MPERSFSRENCSRTPSFFTTNTLAVSTRSYVVNRFLHVRHSRRRRNVLSELRESITFVSPREQKGQRNYATSSHI